MEKIINLQRKKSKSFCSQLHEIEIYRDNKNVIKLINIRKNINKLIKNAKFYG